MRNYDEQVLVAHDGFRETLLSAVSGYDTICV